MIHVSPKSSKRFRNFKKIWPFTNLLWLLKKQKLNEEEEPSQPKETYFHADENMKRPKSLNIYHSTSQKRSSGQRDSGHNPYAPNETTA